MTKLSFLYISDKIHINHYFLHLCVFKETADNLIQSYFQAKELNHHHIQGRQS